MVVRAGVARIWAEGVGFEPTETHKTSTVFETVPFVHSGILPGGRLAGDGGRAYPAMFPQDARAGCRWIIRGGRKSLSRRGRLHPSTCMAGHRSGPSSISHWRAHAADDPGDAHLPARRTGV